MSVLNINADDLKSAIVDKAAEELLGESDHLSSLVRKEVVARIDKLFAERAEAQVSAAIDQAIKDGFEREYQRVTSWGEADGPKTSVRKELDKVVSGYWSAKVSSRTGKPADSDYNAVTRAEYLMTQICAQDFSEGMKQSVLSVTGALKDGLRMQLAAHMDKMLDELFRVKSLQDQGKAEKPW